MNMKTYMTGLAAATALTAFAAPASAVTITGSVSNISYHNTDPGLVLNAGAIAFPSFALNNVGDSQSFNVLSIGTGEGSVELGEDTDPFPISVTFSFSSPLGTSGPPVTGTTFGFYIPFTSCGVLAGGCGAVNWSGPSVFDFGIGGQFSVKLSDVAFGTPGTKNVAAKFTLLANSVPEPSTWAMLLLGFGATGFAMRRRRRQSVQYKFA